VGFYAGRVYAVLSSCFVLGVLISEQARLYSQAALAEATARAEQQVRALANEMPQLAWIAGPDGDIHWYNRRWYEYTGSTPQQMLGSGWQSVHDAAVLPEVLQRWRHCLCTGEPFEMTFPLRGADGVYRPFLTRVSPMRGPGGEVLQWFGTNTDISAQLAAQAQLRLSGQRKDEFLATLAHELRNPLAPIRNAVLLLSRMPDLPADVERLRAIMDRQSRHAVRLVDDLLEIARVSQGKLELRSELVSIADAVDDAIEAVRPAVDAGGLALQVERGEDKLLTVGDPTRLTQIFANLLHNAVKFTPRNGAITVNLQRQAGEAVVSVRDTGVGIPHEHLERVFGLFAQVEEERGNRGGLGLGLALVRGFAELHGGSVRAESAGPGQGSEFIVRLPLRELAAPVGTHQPIPTAESLTRELSSADSAGSGEAR
jgi:PAS domain S-box-containing protein